MSDGTLAVGSCDITSFSVIHSIIIPVGKGEVRISCTDGKVVIKDAELDEAARAFWDAVVKAYPQFRQTIIQGQ